MWRISSIMLPGGFGSGEELPVDVFMLDLDGCKGWLWRTTGISIHFFSEFKEKPFPYSVLVEISLQSTGTRPDTS
jgi:hypothetical protein